jgi:GNAT superfamily N-acetyltransferase
VDGGAVVVVRDARHEDLPGLPAIEAAAALRFVGMGVDAVIDAGPNDVATFAGWLDGVGLLVAEVDGTVVGFAGLGVVDGHCHLAEVDVHPAHHGRGIGRALLAAVVARARERGHDALVLTTFRAVPWNGPWYARHGFVVVPPAEQGPELAAIRAAEAGRGFDALPRVAMRRLLR